MAHFTTKIVCEGGKGYLMLTVPAALRFPAGWARVHLAGIEPCFLYVRGTQAKRFSIPSWHFPTAKAGDLVEVEIEEAQPYRVKGCHEDRFDWVHFIEDDDRVFAIEQPNGWLRLWNRYSAPFDLLRCPLQDAIYRMLGFYQAEGSKGENGNDFSFANTNVLLLENIVQTMREIGIGHDQLYAEILQGVGESRESAIAKYASLPLEVTAVRPRSGQGGSAYVVHAHNSKPFRGMVCRALKWVFSNEFPNRDSAKAFAFGWLDGDGTITLSNGNARLRLAGEHTEQKAVLRALCYTFNWRDRHIHFGPLDQHTEWTLNSVEVMDLALADAFPFSMSRARLLHRIDQTQPDKIARIHRDRFLDGFELLKEELSILRQLQLVDRHPKGEPYPLQKRNGRWLHPAAISSILTGLKKTQ